MPAVPALRAQAPAAAPAPAPAAQRSLGTVTAISATSLSLSTDKGDTVTVTLPANVRVLQVPPGSTDLKAAQTATIGDIVAGDKVLISSRPGDSGAPVALRVIVMKSGAIAQSNEARQQDWQRRGSRGTVVSVDPAAHTITLRGGAKQEKVTTTPATVFRRYAPGSVKFEDATVSTLSDIQPGDQVRVRGDKSADGTTIAVEEVVSGAFRNLAGVLTKVDPAGNTVTLNDLTTKKPVTVTLAADSDMHALPPEMAARFAARARGNAAGGGPAAPAGTRPAYAGGAPAPTVAPSGAPPVGEGEPQHGPGSGPGHAGGDLSQVLPHLPKVTLAELKPGEAVMIVASGASAPGSPLTAITLLSGVEPLLAASPQGGANSFSLSPWSLGGGEGAEGAGPQ